MSLMSSVSQILKAFYIISEIYSVNKATSVKKLAMSRVGIFAQLCAGSVSDGSLTWRPVLRNNTCPGILRATARADALKLLKNDDKDVFTNYELRIST